MYSFTYVLDGNLNTQKRPGENALLMQLRQIGMFVLFGA